MSNPPIKEWKKEFEIRREYRYRCIRTKRIHHEHVVGPYQDGSYRTFERDTFEHLATPPEKYLACFVVEKDAEKGDTLLVNSARVLGDLYLLSVTLPLEDNLDEDFFDKYIRHYTRAEVGDFARKFLEESPDALSIDFTVVEIKEQRCRLGIEILCEDNANSSA